MTRSFMLASAFAALAIAGCATKAETATAENPVTYAIVRADVTIPFSRTVRNFRVGADKSLLLESGHNRWYRATLPQPCRTDLRWEEQIALADRAGGAISKFTDVLVDGNRCQILTLDEIADPRIAEAAARAAPSPEARPAT